MSFDLSIFSQANALSAQTEENTKLQAALNDIEEFASEERVLILENVFDTMKKNRTFDEDAVVTRLSILPTEVISNFHEEDLLRLFECDEACVGIVMDELSAIIPDENEQYSTEDEKEAFEPIESLKEKALAYKNSEL